MSVHAKSVNILFVKYLMELKFSYRLPYNRSVISLRESAFRHITAKQFSYLYWNLYSELGEYSRIYIYILENLDFIYLPMKIAES